MSPVLGLAVLLLRPVAITTIGVKLSIADIPRYSTTPLGFLARLGLRVNRSYSACITSLVALSLQRTSTPSWRNALSAFCKSWRFMSVAPLLSILLIYRIPLPLSSVLPRKS